MTHDPRSTAEILAADPDTIVLEACPPELATISLAGQLLTPMDRYRTAAKLHAFRGCDPLTQQIVHAIAGGREMPDEFAILDTYYDIGAPEVEERCEKIRSEVHRIASAAGVPMRPTFTMLDGRA